MRSQQFKINLKSLKVSKFFVTVAALKLFIFCTKSIPGEMEVEEKD